jgi:rubrerythrin
VITRRTLLLGGASAVLLAGCGGRRVRPPAGNPVDVRILEAALESERAQIALYEAGTKLTADPIVRRILAHERAHAAAVEELLRELGASPPGPRAASVYSRGIPGSAAAWRTHAIAAEDRWSAGYAALIPQLKDPRLRSTFSALMTTEAEHSVALKVA